MDRQEGYYWVKWEREWIVAYWDSPIWHHPYRDGEYKDSNFTRISEDRLQPPLG
jgi:hypothetical protein